nr:MAG: hypothetical protein 2 [Leviviridae sp.]
MAFSDPQTVTINAVANTLPRTGSGQNNGTFQNADGSVRLSISHSFGKRARRTVRIDYSKIAADPLTAENQEFSMSTYVVVDTPLRGLTVTEQKQIVDALTAWLTASSGANVTKVLGSES